MYTVYTLQLIVTVLGYKQIWRPCVSLCSRTRLTSIKYVITLRSALSWSFISNGHIRVNIWPFESWWVGDTNREHMTAGSFLSVWEVKSVTFRGSSKLFNPVWQTCRRSYSSSPLILSLEQKIQQQVANKKSDSRATTAANFQFVSWRLPTSLQTEGWTRWDRDGHGK